MSIIKVPVKLFTVQMHARPGSWTAMCGIKMVVVDVEAESEERAIKLAKANTTAYPNDWNVDDVEEN